MEIGRAAAAVIFAVSLSLLGCASLRPDSVKIPAIEANYPTAEFSACGQSWHGLGICVLESGEDLSKVALSIQGYYLGSVRIANNCKSDQSLPDAVNYTNSSAIPYALPGKAETSCGISFIVSPEFPKEKDQPIVIHSFVGHLYIKVLKPGQKWFGFTSKVVSAPDPLDTISVAVNSPEAVPFFFESGNCSVKIEGTFPATNGVVVIPLKALLPIVPNKTCILNGAILDGATPIRLSWFVAGYSTEFTPLALPSLTVEPGVEFDGFTFKHIERLKVLGDDNVSIVSMDSLYKIDRTATFPFNRNIPHVLRMLTVAGRSVLGFWDPKKGEWGWKQ